MSEYVRIYEVGPRDGLQNEKRPIPTADKIALIDRLSSCGFQKIETTSFVNPKWVPQLADADQVMAGITRRSDVDFAVLTPNMRGFDAALAAGAGEVAIFASASEGFSQKNINCSIAESLQRFTPILDAAKDAKIPVRGYISCVVECPYDGKINPLAVASVLNELDAMGCYEISLGDTLGRATPIEVDSLLQTLATNSQAPKLAGHFHDTNGAALENIRVALDHGIRTFDASVGGLGGCPYAPGAAGNVATEAVVNFLEQNGYETRVDLDMLYPVATFAKTLRLRNV